MTTAEAESRVRSLLPLLAKIALALAIIVALAAGLIWVSFTLLTKLPATVAATVVVGPLTVVGSVLSALLVTQRNRASEIERDHRRQKIVVYEEFFDFLFGLFNATKSGEQPPSEAEMREVFSKFTRKIILWGGPDLLDAWIEVRRVALKNPSGGASAEMIFVMEDFFLAIRKDIGHDNKGLRRGDVFRTFVDNVDQAMPGF